MSARTYRGFAIALLLVACSRIDARPAILASKDASSSAQTTGAAASLWIGVFDTHATGGQGSAVDDLIKGLNQMGYHAEAVTDFHPLVLARYDVLYLSDMHNPGHVVTDWRKRLVEFVEAGGSVLQTWHHHNLSQVGVGVHRVYNSRHMHVVPGHAAVRDVRDFDAAFTDHITERVGPAGTILLKDDDGQPVACAGQLGAGKVISCGLALGIPNGRTARAPRGSERTLLQAFLAWLAPATSRAARADRLVQPPQIYVTPATAMVTAGVPASFRVVVAAAPAEPVTLQSTGARIEPDTHVAPAPARHVTVHQWTVSVPTERNRDATLRPIFAAHIGSKTLRQSVVIHAVHGTAPVNETRGVWLHVRNDRSPKTVMPELKRLGIGMAVLRIAGGTAAYYASHVQPDIQDPLAPDGDSLAEAVKYAHANGIELHPYVNMCVVEGRTSPASLAQLRKAGRLQVDPQGNEIDWYCPSQEVNLQAIERLMIEIVTRYQVDGIQYDFIRYPNSSGCFCAKCRAGFEKETGRKVAHWPNDCVDGPRHAEWVEYRCGRISELVRRVSTHIRQVAPRVRISAAVFRDWPDCRVNNGQDWTRWCREGWLDFVCPMNYTLDPVVFAQRTKTHLSVVPPGFPVVEGIGIASAQGAMKTAQELAVQIAIARKYGAAGFIGFAYQPGHTTQLFTPLHMAK